LTGKSEFLLDKWLSQQFFRMAERMVDDKDTEESKTRLHFRRGELKSLVNLAQASGYSNIKYASTTRRKRT